MHSMRRAIEGFRGGCRVTHPQCETDVVGSGLPKSRCRRLDGRRKIGDARQRLVIDLDQLGGVTRLHQGFRDAEANAIAYMPNSVFGEKRADRPISFRSAGVFGHEQRWQSAETLARDIGARQDGKDTRCARRPICVYGSDPCMRAA